MKRKGTLKTKLLRKWRNEAEIRIGVYELKDNTYAVVFDKSIFPDCRKWNEDRYSEYYQVVRKGIETLEEAKDVCIKVRRSFILREARTEWNEKKFGVKNRYF